MRPVLSTILLALLFATAANADDEFEQPPIRYRDTTPTDRVTRLVERLAKGEVTLVGKNARETLGKLLQELQVPEASQVLVFSKTSLQRQKISPRTPRAIYFNDDTYVGFCQRSNVLEISTADPHLGAVFYTAELLEADSVEIRRQTDNCLICHASSHTRQVPGHVVRSVFVESSGLPALSFGTHRTDHASPLRERWGGWYVTGTHGEQMHLGNFVLAGQRRPEEINNAAGQNVAELTNFFNTDAYLTPHSDLVALMVLEHQVEGHNRITRANFQCRMALHQQEQLKRELGKPADHLWDSTKSRIHSASEDLVRYLLFCEEAPLQGQLRGTSTFAADFTARGPSDNQGRSLRDFDLQRRIFKHPCSYLIYTDAFQGLPAPVKNYVWRRLWEVVSEVDKSPPFAHLSSDDRRAIREIVQATVADLPEMWK